MSWITKDTQNYIDKIKSIYQDSMVCISQTLGENLFSTLTCATYLSNFGFLELSFELLENECMYIAALELAKIYGEEARISLYTDLITILGLNDKFRYNNEKSAYFKFDLSQTFNLQFRGG